MNFRDHCALIKAKEIGYDVYYTDTTVILQKKYSENEQIVIVARHHDVPGGLWMKEHIKIRSRARIYLKTLYRALEPTFKCEFINAGP